MSLTETLAQLSPRRKRLFHCACTRAFFDHLPSIVHTLLVLAEHSADGETAPIPENTIQNRRQWARFFNTTYRDTGALNLGAATVASMLAGNDIWQAALEHQVPMLPDFIGEAKIDCGPTVVQIARAAYRERIMPSGELDRGIIGVLADALEEGGATGEVLAHLRGPARHFRGCWALDAVLGKA